MNLSKRILEIVFAVILLGSPIVTFFLVNTNSDVNNQILKMAPIFPRIELPCHDGPMVCPFGGFLKIELDDGEIFGKYWGPRRLSVDKMNILEKLKYWDAMIYYSRRDPIAAGAILRMGLCQGGRLAKYLSIDKEVVMAELGMRDEFKDYKVIENCRL